MSLAALTLWERLGADKLLRWERTPEAPLNGSEIIGWSREARPLLVHIFGARDAATRVLLLAGQHGDEIHAREAAEQIVREGGPALSGLRLAVISNANPDGAHRTRRTNARGRDLNRDHLTLQEPETRAIHRFVRFWRPQLIIDAHNYPPRRRHLLQLGLIAHYDLLFDLASHPAASGSPRNVQAADFLDAVRADPALRDFECERYTIIDPTGRARHSTCDIVDARNGLSLRHDALTVLIEGRTPTRKEGLAGRARAIAAQTAAIESVLRRAVECVGARATDAVIAPAEGERVAIRFRRRKSPEPCQLKFQDALTRKVKIATFADFRPLVEVTREVTLPAAYAVPRSHPGLLELLDRHGFASCSADPDETCLAERYCSPEAVPAQWTSRPSLQLVRETRGLAEYVLYPTAQHGGRALAVFLEPGSKYGFQRVPECELKLGADRSYPVLRVISR
ncbi:MAG: M14 family zinc carboxypeptidase [Blastocatellia bacterium]|nr:M14 family zinc carboxypeptidase [Blastocatellia bacterium]